MSLKRLVVAAGDPFSLEPVIEVSTATAQQMDVEAEVPMEGEGNTAYRAEHEPLALINEWEFKLLDREQLKEAQDSEKLAEISAARSSIATEGLIDGMGARALDKLIPGFYANAGGSSTFTYTPSLEGVSLALEALDEERANTIRAAFKRVADWAINLYNRLAEMVGKFVERMKASGNAGNSNLMSDLNEKNLATFTSADKIIEFLQEASTSPERVIALLMSGIENLQTDETADQAASVERAQETFKQAMQAIGVKVEAFKKALGSSAYGKKLMGMASDDETPTMEKISKAAEGVQKLADAIRQLSEATTVQAIDQQVQVLSQLQEEYKDALADNSNKAEATQMDLSNHKLTDLYKQAKEYTGDAKDTSDLNSMKATLDTVQRVNRAVQAMASSIPKFGERIATIEGIEETVVSNAQHLLQTSASMVGGLVKSVMTSAGVTTGATGGRVWVISEFVKLINLATVTINRGASALSPEASKHVKENAMRNFGIQMAVNNDSKEPSKDAF